MEQTVAVNLNTDGKINVVWGACAEINIDSALKFIKSGEKEIDKYVNESVLPSLKEYADTVFESENKARIWADGDDDEVMSIGGTHSSMVSSGLAYAYAIAPEDTPVEEWATTHNLIVQGEPATINGYNAITITSGTGIILTQDGGNIEFSFDGYTKEEIDNMIGDVEALINAL